MIDSSLVILGRVFASKIIVVLTLHAIAALSQTIFIKLLELVARIFNTPRELRQYVKLAISQPTFWIDNLIGFGPNGVRQQTRARTRYCFSFIGAIAGYLALAVAAAYLAALYLGEQRLTAYESSLGISPCSYHVTEWGQSSSESHGLILGPFLVKAGYVFITNSTIGEYFEVGIVAPKLQAWTDEDGSATGLAIGKCLKNTVIFGYDVTAPSVADVDCLPSTFEQWLLVLSHWRFGCFHQHRTSERRTHRQSVEIRGRWPG
ncbi:hypothetical protein EDD21DRAFT_375449 [Dissophora ornata]|nr:hypothetical protein EDD21DRAFT_375449 [Dissophora ornata]